MKKNKLKILTVVGILIISMTFLIYNSISNQEEKETLPPEPDNKPVKSTVADMSADNNINGKSDSISEDDSYLRIVKLPARAGPKINPNPVFFENNLEWDDENGFLLMRYYPVKGLDYNFEKVFLGNIKGEEILIKKRLLLTNILSLHRNIRYLDPGGELMFLSKDSSFLGFNMMIYFRFNKYNLISREKIFQVDKMIDLRNCWPEYDINTYYPNTGFFPKSDVFILAVRNGYDIMDSEVPFCMIDKIENNQMNSKQLISKDEARTFDDLYVFRYLFYQPTVSPDEKYIAFLVAKNIQVYEPVLKIIDTNKKKTVCTVSPEIWIKSDKHSRILWVSNNQVLLVLNEESKTSIISADILNDKQKLLLEIKSHKKLVHSTLSGNKLLLTFNDGICLVRDLKNVEWIKMKGIKEYSGAKLDEAGKRIMFTGKDDKDVFLFVYSLKDGKTIRKKIGDGDLSNYQTGWIYKDKRSMIY